MFNGFIMKLLYNDVYMIDMIFHRFIVLKTWACPRARASPPSGVGVVSMVMARHEKLGLYPMDLMKLYW
jgi:hypothetical protein